MSVVLNLAEWLDSNFRRNFDGELLFTGSFVGNKLRYIWEVTSCRGVFGQHCSYTRRVFNWFFFFLFLLFFGWMIRHLLTIPTILCKEGFYSLTTSSPHIMHYSLDILRETLTKKFLHLIIPAPQHDAKQQCCHFCKSASWVARRDFLCSKCKTLSDWHVSLRSKRIIHF